MPYVKNETLAVCGKNLAGSAEGKQMDNLFDKIAGQKVRISTFTDEVIP